MCFIPVIVSQVAGESGCRGETAPPPCRLSLSPAAAKSFTVESSAHRGR